MLYSKIRNLGWCCSLTAIVFTFSCNKPAPPAEHSPETSLKDLKVHEGLEVTLFASEPMFSNPTNIALDIRSQHQSLPERFAVGNNFMVVNIDYRIASGV